jgi:hypothetical protein
MPGNLMGPYIIEFAAGGSNRDIQPFIQNGRVYFNCIALPISVGNLRQDFEFSLDFNDNGWITSPRVKAVYRGTQRNVVNQNKEGYFVAGYAERGMIIITHFFPDIYAVEEWGKSVRFFD